MPAATSKTVSPARPDENSSSKTEVKEEPIKPLVFFLNTVVNPQLNNGVHSSLSKLKRRSWNWTSRESLRQKLKKSVWTQTTGRTEATGRGLLRGRQGGIGTDHLRQPPGGPDRGPDPGTAGGGQGVGNELAEAGTARPRREEEKSAETGGTFCLFCYFTSCGTF